MRNIFFTFLLMASSLTGYQYQLSICGIFHNEARFLEEWIDYHRHVGVEHFYLYNNRSTDDSVEKLQKYIEQGCVTLIDWHHDYDNLIDWNDIQCRAYQDGLKRSNGVSRWLAIIDTDEFIVPVTAKTIPEILVDYQAASGVAVNWVMYGSADIYEVPHDQRMTHRLLLRAPDPKSEHYLVKSIVDPKRVLHMDSPHFCWYLEGCCVNTNWEHVPLYNSPSFAVDKLRINHYWTRDAKFMYEDKIPRGTKMYSDNLKHRTEAILQLNAIYNTIFDDIMLRTW